MLRIGILVSGSGSNMRAIILACLNGFIPGQVVCVISNKAGVLALDRAQQYNIPTFHISNKDFPSREKYDAELVKKLKEYDVQLVVLAGFMRIVSSVLLDTFRNAVMNIHPALLPAFKGEDAQRQALEYGVKFSGCTVHLVDEGTDTGPIIIQAVVPVLDTDNEESLSARILTEEHKIYPEAIRRFAESEFYLEGRITKRHMR